MPPRFRLNYREMEQAQPDLPRRFGLLGLFPRDYSFTWAEACALWAPMAPGPGDMWRSLELLREWRLVAQVPGTDRIYRLPSVVRELALAYLAANPEMRVLGEQRLIDYYTAFASAHNGERPEQLSRIADVYEA